MDIILKIKIRKKETWLEEICNPLEELGFEISRDAFGERKGTKVRGPAIQPEIFVALASAGAFTAFFQTISKVLERNKNREITIERKGVKVNIKGHSLPEERDLLEKLIPEFKKKKS